MRKYLCCLKSALVLLTLATVACGGGGKKNNDPVPVSGVTLSPATLRIPVNGTGQLTATVSPNNATNKNYTWSVNNNLVTVAQNGAVTAGATAGNSTVTVTTEDGSKTAASAVSVFVPVTGVTISPPSITLTAIGQTYTLVASVQPGAAVQTVSWMSDSPSIASVQASGQSCVVTAVAGGTAIITATSSDDPAKTATCAVSVVIPQIIPVASVSLNEHTATLSTSGTLTLTASVSPQNASDKTITWASSAPATASISATTGEHIVVTALATGTTTIRAASLSNPGAYDECVVTVTEMAGPKVYVAGRLLDEEDQYLSLSTLWTNGQPSRLNVTGTYSDAISVFVSENNTVYVAGFETDNNINDNIPLIYVNGEPTYLDAPAEMAGLEPRSVFVSENVVYAAGYGFETAQYYQQAALWADGALTPLPPLTLYAQAYSVYVSGTTVYVAGSSDGQAALWTGSTTGGAFTPQGLQNPEGGYSSGESVFVLNDKVYVAGTTTDQEYNFCATLWIDGTPHNITAYSPNYLTVYSLYVSDGKAYLAGGQPRPGDYIDIARIWEVTLTSDGSGVQGSPRAIDLTDGTAYSYARSVFVSGGDVYAAGSSGIGWANAACMWKIVGEEVITTPLGGADSMANSVFVK